MTANEKLELHKQLFHCYQELVAYRKEVEVLLQAAVQEDNKAEQDELRDIIHTIGWQIYLTIQEMNDI